MKANKEMIVKAREIVEEMELDSKYGYIGIRVQEVPFELGEMNHVSQVLDRGFETAETLNGVCATSINSVAFQEYFGDHVAIVCGNRAEMGEEIGELIIEDAVVEYIFC